MSTIKGRLISGTIFIAIAKYSGIILNIIVIAVLARLISPTDFAIIAIISVFSNFFTLFSDFGIASAIIQKQNLIKDDLNNIFSYCIYLGFILGLTFFGCSYLIADLYNNPNILSLCQLLTIQVFFSSCNIVPNALVLKEQDFRYVAIRTIIIHLLTGSAAILAAFYGSGVKSLLINPIVSSILLFILNYWRIKTIRFLILPKYHSLKIVLNYSLFNLGYNVINYVSRNLDKLLIGKFLPLSQLGYYEKSYSMMMLPIQNVISVVNPVIHPVLSKYQDNEEVIFKYLSGSSKIFSWIGFPLSVICYTYGSHIIHILLGDNWDPAIEIFKIFSLSIGFQLVYALQGPFFLIRNNPKVMMLCGIITMVLNLSALFTGLFMFEGLSYIALMIDISYMLSLVITFCALLNSCFKHYPKKYWANLILPIVSSIIYLIICMAFETLEVALLSNMLIAIATIILVLLSLKNVIPLFISLK